MARPQRIEKLRHGRLLCGSVFRFFVETWNWLTAYVDNMKGDAETDPQSGYITIDRTDPDHPVIRFRADKVAAGGGGGESTPQPFDIDDNVVVRCYAPAPCGTMLVGANYAIDGNKGDILVHVDRDLQTGVYTLTVDQTHRAESPTHHEWTLYQYQGGDVVCDCRPRVLPLIRFDDKSLDIDATNHNLQIKSFNNPTSAASDTTLADDLQAQSAVQGHVLYRNADGTLEYKTIGQLSGGTVEFVADIDWYVDGSVHVLRKRLRVLNLRTGAVADKPNTTYANGWEVAANSIGISSIIGS